METQLIRIHKVIKYEWGLNSVEKKCVTDFHDKTASLTAITGIREPSSQTMRSFKPNTIPKLKIIIDYQNQQYFKQTNVNFAK